MELTIERQPGDLFVWMPDRLNGDFVQHVVGERLGRPVHVRDCRVTNLCSGMFGGTACSGATVLHIRLDLHEGESIDLVAKILSPDPVNLYKIDCRFDSRISEVRWSEWWGQRDRAWLPRVYDTHLDIDRREFWIVREHLPQIGWPDVTVSNWGHFKLTGPRLLRLIETLAEVHADSAKAIDELLGLLPGDGIRYGAACRLDDLVRGLDEFIDDERLLKVIGIGDAERDQVKQYRDAVAERPRWLDEWTTVLTTHDVKPDNFGFRDGDRNQPVFLDFGAARLAPIEEELTLMLGRLDADDVLRDHILRSYLDHLAQIGGPRIEMIDLMRRLPWAEPALLLRSLIEQANALRWVPHQDRSKGYIRHFIRVVGNRLARCPR